MRTEERQKDGEAAASGDAALDEQPPKTDKISIWEWLAALIGLISVVAVIGFILYRGIAGSEAPPEVEIRTETVERVGDAYLVRFSAYNRGGETASTLVLEAELSRGAEKTETSQVTISYLPADSIRRGGFYFRQDPRQFKLQTRVVGYQEP